jgi:hypothetical protein
MLDDPRGTTLVQKVGDHGGLCEDSVTHSQPKKASINRSRRYSIKIKNRGKKERKRNEKESSRLEVPIVISSSSPTGNSAESRDDDDVALNRKSDERKIAVDDNYTISESISVLTNVFFEDYSMLLSDSDSDSDSDTINDREYDFFEEGRATRSTVGRNIIDDSNPNREEVFWIFLAYVFCSSLSVCWSWSWVDEFDARDMVKLCEALEEDIRVDEFEAREIAKFVGAECYTTTELEDHDEGSYLVDVHHVRDQSTRDYEDDATKAEKYNGVGASSIVSLSPCLMPIRKPRSPISGEIWQNKPSVEGCDNMKAKTTEVVVQQVADAKQEDSRSVTTAEAPQIVAANQKYTKLPITNAAIDPVVDVNPILKVIRKKESSAQSVTGNRSKKSVRKSPLRVLAMLRKKKEALVKGNPVTPIDPVEIAEKNDPNDPSDEKKKEAMVKGILETKIVIASFDAIEITEKDAIQDFSDEVRDDFHTLPLKTNQRATGEESRDNNGDTVNMESLLKVAAALKLSLDQYDKRINSKHEYCTGDDNGVSTHQRLRLRSRRQSVTTT